MADYQTTDRTDRLINRYMFRPTKTLGQGASCKVVRATRKDDKIQCAVKIMSKSKKVHRVMYGQEISILENLEHPNIVRFIEADDSDPRDFYVVTKLNSGGELFDRIVGEEWEMTEVVVSSIVQQMLQAINYLHRQNIVHRDLKPENFLFETNSPDAKLILIDFGTAITVEDDAKYTDLVGTPFYLAPESATNQPYRTGRMLKSSDLWAVGVIAYICITGTPPFYGESNREICRNIVKQRLEFPQIEMSNGFKDFCGRALQKRWKKRLSMDDAMQHPWVIGEAAEAHSINLDTIRSLRQFAAQTRLKKAVARILAQNMGEGPEARVREHFERLDADGNNTLDIDELSHIMKDLGYHPSESRQEAERIMAEVDVDNNNAISFEEFATVWQRKLLTVNDQYIRAVFGVLDSNGDGYIDKEELKGVLEGMTEEDIDSMINEADQSKNGDAPDGKIDFEEFKNAMKEQVAPANIEATRGNKLNKDDLVAEQQDVNEIHEE